MKAEPGESPALICALAECLRSTAKPPICAGAGASRVVLAACTHAHRGVNLALP